MREEIAISQEWSALINSEIESGLLRYHSNHVTNVRLYPQQVFSISVAILSADDSFPNPFAESLQHGFRNFAQCHGKRVSLAYHLDIPLIFCLLHDGFAFVSCLESHSHKWLIFLLQMGHDVDWCWIGGHIFGLQKL